MNINKYIAQAGVTSRRGADELIKQKRVRINEKFADPTDKVKETDRVYVNGLEISPVKEKIYIAFNKPVGVITTTDKDSPNNIIDYIKFPQRIFPVGRLDVNTSGLIILTNDGDFTQILTKGKKVEKEYLVSVRKTVDQGFLITLENGIFLDGYRTLPAKAHQVSDKSFTLTIVEGKNRQVRRMCEMLGNEVVNLKRIRIGNLLLDDIKVGKFIELKEDEIKGLMGI